MYVEIREKCFGFGFISNLIYEDKFEVKIFFMEIKYSCLIRKDKVIVEFYFLIFYVGFFVNLFDIMI